MSENNFYTENQTKPILSILEILRGAKSYLAESWTEFDEQGRYGELRASAQKELHVCFAAENFLLQRYNCKELITGTPERIAYAATQDYIYANLRKFAHSIEPKCSTVFFSYDYAKLFVPGVVEPGISSRNKLDLKQKARHLWLDSLIAELERS